MEQSVKILSKSSSVDPYTTTFYLDKYPISAFCSCPAGEYRKLCKHVVQMINGDDSILYNSDQKVTLAKIYSHLENTPIPLLLSELSKKEMLLKKAQNEVKRPRKILRK